MKVRKLMVIVTLSLLITFVAGVMVYGYDEVPMFEDRVANGELPPMEDRLPEEPYIVDPVERVGDYGGTLFSVAARADSWGEDIMLMDFMNCFVKPDPETMEMVPNLAKKVESSSDYTTYTVHLREDTKWSDGQPFTTEDILFWYEDVLLNEDLTPVVSQVWKADGKVFELEVIDEYTFKYKFASPQPYFLKNIFTQGMGGSLIPKHYLKQFHPNYTSEEKLNEMVKEAGFDHWYQFFEDQQHYLMNNIPLKEELPTLTAYVLTEKSSSKRIWERNPYFWKADSEGNQLPYIDKIRTQIVSKIELENTEIINGNVDFAGFNTSILNYPMYKDYEEKGGYQVYLWESGFGSEVIYQLNLNHEDPVLREIFQDVRFRRALSLGMDRHEINESIYFGRGTPRQFTVVDKSKYFKEEFENAYVEYNPERAKELLDEMGLDEKDSEGYRLRPDGERLTFTFEFCEGEIPILPNIELVTQHWQDLGINVKSKQISGELLSERASGNMLDAEVFMGDKATDIMFPVYAQYVVPFPPGWETTMWPEWGIWFNTDGESGEEPPAEIKELYGWWEDMMSEPDEEKRIELGHKILAKQAENLWVIGTIGKAPWVGIVDNDLRNVPEDVFWVWDVAYVTSYDPEQFFFEDGINEE